jgi:RHS repeat-associated protein
LHRSPLSAKLASKEKSFQQRERVIVHCQQAAIAPQQNPFLYGDLMPEETEGEYNVSTSQKLIYMPDQLGSVRDVLDGTSGSLVASYDFTPYGGVARSNVTNGTDYQYAGLFAHVASGLNFSATRALDGATGRWLNRDLIREAGGINLYAYIGAKPLGWTDRRGLFGEKMLSPWDSVADRITGIGGQCPTGACSNAQTTRSEANVADAIGTAAAVVGVGAAIAGSGAVAGPAVIIGFCAEAVKQTLEPNPLVFGATSSVDFGVKAIGAEALGTAIDASKIIITLAR